MTTFTATNAVGTYEVETAFDGATTGTTKTFGRNVTIDTYEGVNNGTQLYQFSNRTPQQIVEQNFEGSFSVSFVLSSFEFLELYDSTVTDEGSDGDDDYDFDEPQSFEMVVHREDSGITRVAKGCIPQSLELDVQVDGTVNVSIDGVYANEEKRTGETLTQPTITDNKDAINFADIDLQYQGSALSLPRGVTISLDNSMTLLSVLGQRTAGDYTVGTLTGSVDITHAVEVDETTTLESMYGASGSVGDTVTDDNAMTVTFDNGKTSGSGQVKAVWSLTGFTENYSESGIDVEEDFIEADISETLKSVAVEVTED